MCNVCVYVECVCALCTHVDWDKSPLRHAYGFVPHECCTARAYVVAGVRLVSMCLRGHFVQGGEGGA